jgi:hypothetical protein
LTIEELNLTMESEKPFELKSKELEFEMVHELCDTSQE